VCPPEVVARDASERGVDHPGIIKLLHVFEAPGKVRNVKRFRGGLVFKAHRLVCHSTLGWRVIQKKKEQGQSRVRAKKGQLKRF